MLKKREFKGSQEEGIIDLDEMTRELSKLDSEIGEKTGLLKRIEEEIREVENNLFSSLDVKNIGDAKGRMKELEGDLERKVREIQEVYQALMEEVQCYRS